MSSESLKCTPLYHEHVSLRARMVDFGGWEMPVHYSSIMDEHHTVRNSCGVFDISHMGRFMLSGEGASSWLGEQFTNNPARLEDGHGQYTLMLNDKGGVIDDLIIYRIHSQEWLLVVNAARIQEDYVWLSARLPGGLTLIDASEYYAGLAVQGPEAAAVFEQWSGDHLPPRNGIRVEQGTFICRTGYTGEDGFEIFMPAGNAVTVWRSLLDLGAKPCGLGARDTLRMESCYPLNGNDLAPDLTPLQAGLGFFVDLEKPAFTGRDALIAQKTNGLPSKLIAFKMIGTTPPPRSHYPVLHEGKKVGETCSGGLSPTLGGGIGMAYVPEQVAKPGTEIAIEIRGRSFPARIEKKPLYRSLHLPKPAASK